MIVPPLCRTGAAAPRSVTVTLPSDQRAASRTRLLLDKQPDCEWSAEPQEGTAAIAVVELDSLKGAGGSLSDPLAVPSVPVRG